MEEFCGRCGFEHIQYDECLLDEYWITQKDHDKYHEEDRP